MFKRIGNYRVGDPIGVGTVGTVYRAKHRKTGQVGALKILLPQVSEDENVVRRFEREMSLLEKLDHKNIVRYLDDGRHDGRLFYVMELVDSGSIKDELQIHGRLPWPQVCRYGKQICSALQHAHNHGIIHRDLKPSNLFMTEDGQLKLGDFGIARDTHATDLTDTGLTVGTYAYMSPEQICGDDSISDEADLYALGCLFFEMLTGRQPYPGANFAQIFEQHLNSDPPSVREHVPECPEELDDMIKRLMAKKPSDRPFNARYIQGFLQDLIEKYANLGPLPETPTAAAPLVRAGGAVPAMATGPAQSYEGVSWLTIAGILAAVVIAMAAVYAATHT